MTLHTFAITQSNATRDRCNRLVTQNKLPRSIFPRNRGFYRLTCNVYRNITLARCVVTLCLFGNGTRARDPCEKPRQWWFLFRGPIVKGFVKPGKCGRAPNRSESSTRVNDEIPAWTRPNAIKICARKIFQASSHAVCKNSKKAKWAKEVTRENKNKQKIVK